MKKILEKTFTVKQIFLFLLLPSTGLVYLYIGSIVSLGAKEQFGGVGFRDSPYVNFIPSECRHSAADSGYAGLRGHPVNPSIDLKDHLSHDALFIQPNGYIYSLPESEKKLGFGMRGLPCMGYDFLMLLHGTDFKRKDYFLDEQGEVTASVTYEIFKPYKKSLPKNLWLNGWDEIFNPPKNDASLVQIKTQGSGWKNPEVIPKSLPTAGALH